MPNYFFKDKPEINIPLLSDFDKRHFLISKNINFLIKKNEKMKMWK
jgi:hypothetical protein